MMGWQDSFQPIAASGVSGGWQSSFQPASYSQNVGQDWSNAENKIGQIWQNLQSPDGMNPASAGLQMLGTAASGAYAPVGEAARSAYNSLPNVITQPINNAASSGAQVVQSAYNDNINYLADTGAGKAIGDYLMNSPHIQNGMKEVSDDAKSLANLLTLAKVKPAIGEASQALGDTLVDSGEGAQNTVKESYIQSLVLPKETPTVKADNALRTVQIDGKNVYQPNQAELNMAQTVSAIPNVTNSNSYQANLSAIVNANKQEATALKSRLQQANVPIDLGTVQNGIDQSMQTLSEHPYVTGEGVNAANNVVKIMNKSILDNASEDGTIGAADLLQARKDFDNALPSRIFTSPTDTPVTVAAKQMRSMVNGLIANADPSADVLDSLKKQSTLYDAADNIAPKAAGEAKTPIGRMAQSVMPHNLTNAVGGAGLGAAALAASHYVNIPSPVIGVALGGYSLYKGATAPTTRILLGKALGGGQ